MQTSCCARLECHVGQVQFHHSTRDKPILTLSYSRSGAPTWSSVSSSTDPPPWSTSVSWEKADILTPTSYRSFLRGADAVVHSMGILLEADYKGVLQGKEPIISGLQKAFGATRANPLEKEIVQKEGQLTYELMNRDSGNDIPNFNTFCCGS